MSKGSFKSRRYYCPVPINVYHEGRCLGLFQLRVHTGRTVRPHAKSWLRRKSLVEPKHCLFCDTPLGGLDSAPLGAMAELRSVTDQPRLYAAICTTCSNRPRLVPVVYRRVVEVFSQA